MKGNLRSARQYEAYRSDLAPLSSFHTLSLDHNVDLPCDPFFFFLLPITAKLSLCRGEFGEEKHTNGSSAAVAEARGQDE